MAKDKPAASKPSSAGTDALSRINSVKKPNGAAAISIATVSMESIREMDMAKLVESLNLNCTKAASAAYALSKMIASLDERRNKEEDKTLRKFVAKHAPKAILETSIYQGALAFTGMVSDIAPEKGKVFNGKIVESEYDSTPFAWLRVVATILNTLDSKYEGEPTLSATVREMVAVVLRTLPKDGKAQLSAILKELRPIAEDGGDKTKEEEEAVPVGFTDEEVRLMVKGIMDRTKLTKELAVLTLLRDSFGALGAIASKCIEELPAEAPAQQAA